MNDTAQIVDLKDCDSFPQKLSILGMSCYFHYWADKNQYCSLTNAKRWAFIMSENLLPLFRLPFISGRHIPEKEEYLGIEESKVQFWCPWF
jgi:hypothetical protein